MRRTLFLIICLTLLTTMQAQELFIVHTNDSHSCIEPIDPHSADTAMADKGGYLRRMTLLKELRTQHPNMLLVDCGDFSQGSAYYELFKGEVEISLMNLMGYEAATIGNHEFDFGLDNMARIFALAKFPVVCCNYDCKGTVLEPYVKPYTILKKNGLKVGIFGLSPQPEGLVTKENYKGLTYIDPITAAQQTADILKNKEKCDLVICLSHLGWHLDNDVCDEELVPATRNIDIVLGGHSHTYMQHPVILKNKDGKDVPVSQMGKNARFVGTFTVNYSK